MYVGFLEDILRAWKEENKEACGVAAADYVKYTKKGSSGKKSWL